MPPSDSLRTDAAGPAVEPEPPLFVDCVAHRGAPKESAGIHHLLSAPVTEFALLCTLTQDPPARSGTWTLWRTFKQVASLHRLLASSTSHKLPDGFPSELEVPLLPLLGVGPAAPAARQASLGRWLRKLSVSVDMASIGGARDFFCVPTPASSPAEHAPHRLAARTEAAILRILPTLTPEETEAVGLTDDFDRHREACDLSRAEIERLLEVQRARLSSSPSSRRQRTQSESSDFEEVSADAGTVVADLTELEAALAEEAREVETMRRVAEIEIREDDDAEPAALGPSAGGSPGAASPMSDGFSEGMKANGLPHRSGDGHEVFLHAADLPDELDLFHLPAEIEAVAEAAGGRSGSGGGGSGHYGGSGGSSDIDATGAAVRLLDGGDFANKELSAAVADGGAEGAEVGVCASDARASAGEIDGT